MDFEETNIKYPEISLEYQISKRRRVWNTVLEYAKRNSFFHITLILLFLKSLTFLAITHNNDASWIDVFYVIGNDIPIHVYLSFVIIFICFALLFKNRTQVIFLIIFNLLVSIICIIDIWYYRGFGSFTTFHLFQQTANLDNLGESILSFVHLIDFIFVIDILIMIFIYCRYKKVFRNAKRNVLLFLILILLSGGCLGFVHYWYDIKEKGEDWQRYFPKERSSNPKLTLFNLSMIGYHVFDAYAFFVDSRPYILSNDDKKSIESWFHYKQENIPDNKYKGMFKGKNLIVIQVESLEKFILNEKVNNQEITPNLNRILKNSIYFTNFFEQTNRGNSSDADLLTNTSVYPLKEGSTFFRYPKNTYNSFPKMMKGLGYYTLAIHPDKGGFWNWMPALYNIGFDRCIDVSQFNLDEYIGLGLSDGSYLRQVFPVVKDLKQPFYTFMVTLTSHVPFELPKEYKGLNIEEKLDSTKLGGYFQSINYTDKQLGIFLDNLDKDGILDNTVVVIYGDHCGPHKYYNDELNKIEPSEPWWYSGSYQIPLIIYNKNMNGEEMSVFGGQVDTLPTVLYLMGVEESTYANTAMGRNLLKTNRNFAVLSSGSFMGTSKSEDDQSNAKQGIDVADKILRSNYFKDKTN